MRDIKFRGMWKKDNGKWVYGSYHYCTGTGEMRHHEWDDRGNRIVSKTATFNSHFILEHQTPDSVGWVVRNTFIPYDVIPETVGQFTGLKDKSDQDIYEGDIVQGKSMVGSDIIKGVVFFNEARGGWAVREKTDHSQPDIEYLSELTKPLYELQVIGNIHENQELLNT